jgi:VanZ family protein
MAGIVLVIWFGLLSAFLSLSVSRPFRFDLVEHMRVFGWLSLIDVLLWAPAWPVTGGLIVAAGLLEVVQTVFPLRQASAVDWGASTAGVVSGRALSLPVRCGGFWQVEVLPGDSHA